MIYLTFLHSQFIIDIIYSQLIVGVNTSNCPYNMIIIDSVWS